eukprot:m.110586 g.110586  ORF g.110586 m.110586 type:complete len:71 (+) comp16982_c0_seq1:80-292(+)
MVRTILHYCCQQCFFQQERSKLICLNCNVPDVVGPPMKNDIKTVSSVENHGAHRKNKRAGSRSTINNKNG